MRVVEVMQDKTTSTMQQGIETNHKSLQSTWKQTLKSYKSNMGTNYHKHTEKTTLNINKPK